MRPMSGSFADSNVILYLLSEDEPRRAIARALLRSELTISVQVLNEVAAVASRKLKLDWAKIGGFINDLVPLVGLRVVTIGTHNAGRAIASRYGFRFYDALIVASATEASCSTLLTEDMHHGQKIGGLTIVNPFR